MFREQAQVEVCVRVKNCRSYFMKIIIKFYIKSFNIVLGCLPFLSIFSGCGMEVSLAEHEDTASQSVNGMVVSPEIIAGRIGLDVLKNGGNAVDAAVTMGFVLAVTFPEAGNIGGGGFMIYHDSEKNQSYAVDYREKAPKLSNRSMFLDERGNVDPEKSQSSYLAVGVPGSVRGLALALDEFGTIELREAIEPAIRLAEDGYPMPQWLFDQLQYPWIKSRLQKSHASDVFYPENGSPVPVGETFIQKDLARSLRLISEFGPEGFYEGEVANLIAAGMEKNGGLIRKEDLREYRAVVREPIHCEYRGYDVYTMPPPSSGGVHIVQMLGMLEAIPSDVTSKDEVERTHLLAEVMKRAFADRAIYLGDPDFVRVPVEEITSRDYLKNRVSDFDPSRATPSHEIHLGEIPTMYESSETTHFSVVDRWGNAVSNTYTLNFPYGSGQMVKGTGILLNNEMDDFSTDPDSRSSSPRISGEANAIEPQKRMLSSMSPTIIQKDGEVVLVTGSPGGVTIIATVLQIITNVIDGKMTIDDATRAPRVHHQWSPDELLVERGRFSNAQLGQLRALGHRVKEVESFGIAQSILIRDRVRYGFTDSRDARGVALGY